MESVIDNLLRVMDLIAKAALRSQRNPAEIKLVAVSKTV